jgi:hypothetical protein
MKFFAASCAFARPTGEEKEEVAPRGRIQRRRRMQRVTRAVVDLVERRDRALLPLVEDFEVRRGQTADRFVVPVHNRHRHLDEVHVHGLLHLRRRRCRDDETNCAREGYEPAHDHDSWWRTACTQR